MPLTLLPPSQPTRGEPPQETQLDRLLKLVPCEILLFYPAAIALAPSPAWHLALLGLGLGLSLASLHLDGRAWHLPQDWRQYAVRSATFVAWALALGDPLGAWLDGAQVRRIAAFLSLGIPIAGYLLLPLEPTAPE